VRERERERAVNELREKGSKEGVWDMVGPESHVVMATTVIIRTYIRNLTISRDEN
jgi:hypothetical protein